MARATRSFVHGRQQASSSKVLYFVAMALILPIISVLILLYISSTWKLVIHSHHAHLYVKPLLESSSILHNPPIVQVPLEKPTETARLYLPEMPKASPRTPSFVATNGSSSDHDLKESLPPRRRSGHPFVASTTKRKTVSNGNKVNFQDVFLDRDIFMENYREMNKSLKIYIYPHKQNDSFANVLLPEKREPSGNYASESYFKKALTNSHFITKDPSKADLFFLPFSIAGLRNDKRVGVGGIKNYIHGYISSISHGYPYWNRTGGADHFYVTCHSVGRTAMEKAQAVRNNAIQVVCSSSYFVPGYVAHKDTSVPQIWPRRGTPPNLDTSRRKMLAFYAGAMNSRVREFLVQQWGNDSEISVHQRRLRTPYADLLLGSKFCIHAKGYEVNTARIGDAFYYGCIPVILADHYELPFSDILNWSSFSVVLATSDIPSLKRILTGISLDEYLRMRKNVVKVRNHFQWHSFPVDFDAFYMVMYELWLRRSSVRIL